MGKRDTTLRLGDVVKDRITGFKGVVTGFFEYLNGCVRLCVQPEELKDGKPVEAVIFDVEQLDLVKKQKHAQSPEPSGGPFDAPASRSSPARR